MSSGRSVKRVAQARRERRVSADGAGRRRARGLVHRLHRWSGTAMALLMLVWFASGAVMTFAEYPAYTDAERLAHAAPLAAAVAIDEGAGRSAAAPDVLRAAPLSAAVAMDDGAGRDEAEPGVLRAMPLAAAVALPGTVGSGAPVQSMLKDPPLTAASAAAAEAVRIPTQLAVSDQPLIAAVPPALMEWLRAGGQARLMMLEGEPRWLLQSADGYQALRTTPPWEVATLDAARARAEAQRTHGTCRGELSIIDEPDQWTVGRSHPGSYPLQRIVCDDARGLELYVSTRSGEIVQESTRGERLLAWLGPIPHWIYPAALRRDPAAWRNLVLWLAAFGLLATSTGMVAGVGSLLRARRNARHATQHVYLRWHQRLGLGFGLGASAWVFSGALSLEPFHWASSDHDDDRAAAWSQVVIRPELGLQLQAALASCRERLPELRELELVAFGTLHAVCSDMHAQTRVVDLEDPTFTARRRLTDERLQQLAAALGEGAQVALSEVADDYYYPTHRQAIAKPYARFTLHDAADTVLYVDPARAQLVQQSDSKKRIERWLYHGLHSWDYAALYEQRTLWRALMIAVMLVGAALATLGVLIFLRRQRQRRLHAHAGRRHGPRS